MMKQQETEPKWSRERELPWDWSRKKLLTLSCWSSLAELISAIDGCDPPARNGLSLSHTVSIVFRDCFKLASASAAKVGFFVLPIIGAISRCTTNWAASKVGFINKRIHYSHKHWNAEFFFLNSQNLTSVFLRPYRKLSGNEILHVNHGVNYQHHGAEFQSASQACGQHMLFSLGLQGTCKWRKKNRNAVEVD
jgi:hypothetical protein